MREIPKTQAQMAPGTSGSYATIVSNSNEGATPTPTIIKVKHLRVAADLYIGVAIGIYGGLKVAIWATRVATLAQSVALGIQNAVLGVHTVRLS